jgi:glycine/D-amino acid oxidase-like deaminating enzyme
MPTDPREIARYSFWLANAGDLTPRAPLPGDRDFDVAIVGGGFTGLWTAYYLRGADPTLRVAVLEKTVAGFGASGRNGGWCLGLMAASNDKVIASHGRDAALRTRHVMFATVDEIARVCEEEGIDAHFAKGGNLTVARDGPQRERLRAAYSSDHDVGLSEEDLAWLDPQEAAKHITIAGTVAATYSPHCAALQPARLARGLAEAVERGGVEIFEQTTVTRVEPRRVHTDRGVVRSDIVVMGLEGYSASIPDMGRRMIPMKISMVVTEPLPSSFWDAAGWGLRETLDDKRHMYIYAQRTADDRIAIGGGGIAYGYGSRIDDTPGAMAGTEADMLRSLRTFWPGTRFDVADRWSGYIGLPRDWHPSVGLDRATGIAWSGGYVGDGVSTANLGGRTLTDLITGRTSDLTELPWVGHRSRRWEPEPLRWLGTRILTAGFGRADRREATTGEPWPFGEKLLALLNR